MRPALVMLLNCIVYQDFDLLALRLQLPQGSLGKGSHARILSYIHPHALAAARQQPLLQLASCFLTPAALLCIYTLPP